VRAALILTALAGAAASAPATAAATPAEDLGRARDAFRKGDYQVAIPLLNYLLYPSPRLAQTRDLVEAHVLFAVCALETGDRLTAAREFEEALFLQADLELDGNALFSRAAIDLFAETRAAFEERARRDAERRALAEERERLRRYRESLIVYEVRPYYVNFIPFGAGQFQNGDRKKGLAFAASQAITGGVSAGIWLYLVGEYGIGGAVPADEVDRARRLQEIEVGAGIACLGLVAWGVVDSLLHYRPRVQVSGDDSLLPTDVVPPATPGKRPSRPTPAPPEKPPTSSLRFTPVPLPGGAGATLTWDF
jgi:tetratricopeptide (TPR) repeat protein